MPLKIAVPNKGRLAEETLALLRAIGIRAPSAPDRTLLVTANGGKYQILFARAQDIPEFVMIGAADVGITGIDLVEESGCKVEKMIDLDFGFCKLVVAAPEGSSITSVDDIPAGARVATAFPNVTGRFFEKKRKRIILVPVSGAAEITPAIGVADVVVDLTQTGSTLRHNHLSLLDVVLDSHAILVAGSDTLRRRRQEVEDLAHAFASVQEAAHKRYLMVNAPKKKIKSIVRLIPGLKSPTIVSLADKGLAAVHAVVDEEAVTELVPRLKKAGATGILILPIERMVP